MKFLHCKNFWGWTKRRSANNIPMYIALILKIGAVLSQCCEYKHIFFLTRHLFFGFLLKSFLLYTIHSIAVLSAYYIPTFLIEQVLYVRPYYYYVYSLVNLMFQEVKRKFQFQLIKVLCIPTIHTIFYFIFQKEL